MDMTFFIFLSSGLFLGWSLGANDASNVFGTAVGTKMVSFKTAAVIASLFITVGARLCRCRRQRNLGRAGFHQYASRCLYGRFCCRNQSLLDGT